MFGLSKLWNACGELAANLLALSATVKQINTGLRAGLYLDEPGPHPALAAGTEPGRQGITSSPCRRRLPSPVASLRFRCVLGLRVPRREKSV
jgi:hypothetical protein